MAGLLNRSHVKAFILEAVKHEHPGWTCTRVSGAALGVIERMLERRIRAMLREHPSKGKTFDPPDLHQGE